MTKNKVLIIEDNKWQAEHFKSQLDKSGFEAIIAGNAIEAIDKLEKFIPDVIVLDLLMPGTNGLAVIHEIKTYPDLKKIPIVVCSSIADRIKQGELKDYGVVSVIDKTTIQPNEIVFAVKEAILLNE